MVGVIAVPGNFSRKKPRAIVFGKEYFLLDEEGTWYAVRLLFLQQDVD